MKLRALFLGVGVALVALVGPAGAGAAPAEPAWSLEATSYPTNFVPGTTGTIPTSPGYFVTAMNVGAAATHGSFTISDFIPAGVTPKAAFGFAGFLGKPSGELSCSVAAHTVTCTGNQSLEPNEFAQIRIAVEVSGSASGNLENEVLVSGGGALSRGVSRTTPVSSESPNFGFLPGAAGASFTASESAGFASVLAGEHPYQLQVNLGFPTVATANGKELLSVGGGPKDVEVTLPPGIVANPQAAPKCTESELEASGCPLASQVGVAIPTTGFSLIGAKANPLYNMVSAPGSPAEFAFEVAEGAYVHLQGALRNDGQYVLSASSNDIIAKVAIFGVTTVLWGDPADASHDASRGPCVNAVLPAGSCAVPRVNKAFLTQPSACSGSLSMSLAADSWINPGFPDRRTVLGTDFEGNPFGIEGCSELGFEPSIAFAPDTTIADSPAGLRVDLKVPQKEGFDERAVATLKSAKVTLPPGFVVNPSAANGRGACDAAQVGLESGSGQTPARFSEAHPACPDNAKVGTIEIETPLLKDPLDGAVYLATPFENPFGTLLGLYIVIDDPQTGIILKLAGKVEPDPVTGQLTTSFEENPQLPFEDFRLNFFGGRRAALRTPQVCGTSSSLSMLSPWSGTLPVSLSSPLTVDHGANGAPCAGSVSQLPNQPSFAAGTADPVAGQYSPFVLHLNREDGSQELGALNVSLPQGLTGKLAGIPYCPEAALAEAAQKSGRAEEAHSSCPSASEVGTVVVGAGAGPAPYYASGKAYLAGPYKGAPISLAVITPAVAGPFDLGTVVVRAAAYVDLETAQITVKSDPLPTILKGIPLDVRSIVFNVNRPNFTLNPTSCEPMTLSGTAISTTGNEARVSNPFKVGNCAALKFKPEVKINLKGPTKRSGHPALKAVVTYPKKGAYANIARAQVGLPHSEFLDQGNIGTVCTQSQLKSQTCPAKSIYGRAKAWSPLLEKPLEGPVYLGVGYGHKLPDLVADLNGQVRILVHGRVDTTKHHGIRNTFEFVPDAPVSRFVLEMKGGKKYGLLENSENICRKVQRAAAKFVAYNGRSATLRPKISNSCKKNKAAKPKKKSR